MQTTTRNASLADLATLLTEQQARKIDVVAPASKLRSKDGNLVIAVTSFAQTIADADVAADFEAAGVRAMELAAAN